MYSLAISLYDILCYTFLFFFNFILFFKLYIIVLVLPNIKMNPPVLYFSTERTERQFCLSSGMIDQINSVCLAIDSLKVL